MERDHRADHSRRDFLTVAAGGVVALSARVTVAHGQTGGNPRLKIGMIGSGREGGALGTAFVKAGHPVMFSSRHPEELNSLVDGLGPLARAGTVTEAIAFGDVVMIAVPYGAMQQIGHDYATALAKKVLVVDVSNPNARRDGADLVQSVEEQGGAGLATAKMLPGAHLVRAFNAIGSARIASDAYRPGGLVGVPVAGDDAKAVVIASALIRQIGFEPVQIGGLAMGKYLVPGSPLAGEHTPDEIRKIAAGLG